MKNKYQEALDFIIDCIEFNYKTIKDLEAIEFYCDTLQELVDKETPMKPYYPNEYPSACCRKCFQNLGDNNYCRNCGQRVLWED